MVQDEGMMGRGLLSTALGALAFATAAGAHVDRTQRHDAAAVERMEGMIAHAGCAVITRCRGLFITVGDDLLCVCADRNCSGKRDGEGHGQR